MPNTYSVLMLDICFIENKPVDTTTNQVISTDLAQEINTETSKVSTIPTAAPKHPPESSKLDTLLRIKRQLALENELSLAADESENLGIEQVSSNCRSNFCSNQNYRIPIKFQI